MDFEIPCKQYSELDNIRQGSEAEVYKLFFLSYFFNDFVSPKFNHGNNLYMYNHESS